MTLPPFAHLHVASSFSRQYGASTPAHLVARAGENGQHLLGLTDRDGLGGAVRFVLAATQAGIRPVIGVDLATAQLATAQLATTRLGPGPSTPGGGPRTPARGGAWVDPRHPRAVLLARDRRGWASLARLVSAAYTGRTDPVLTPQILADHLDGVVVLLGPHSQVAAALAARRPDLADALVAPWHEILGPALHIEVVSHRAPSGPFATASAARLLGWARDRGLPVVLAHAVRYADPAGARVVDVLDSARRLVPLSERHRDRVNAQGHLLDNLGMAQIAEEITRAAGVRSARALYTSAADLAEQCILTPADLGIGDIVVPETAVVLGSATAPADTVLRRRCTDGLTRYRGRERRAAADRLDAELRTIATLGFATYFLTVAEVVDLTRELGVRVAARGSGAGSLVTHLLGISGVDPMRHGLLMERFLTPLRRALPDIDLDVESARRTDVYDAILARFGAERVACVSMLETYRVRHAIRDVGAALGLPPSEVDALAKAFPHIRARDVRAALEDLPELRDSGLGRRARAGDLDHLWDLVAALDGLPRHIALHPCGVLLADATLLDRTPVQPSAAGYPMSQFDKDDVEEIGLLKLDVLGIRMQSALTHAVAEVARVDGVEVDLDAVPLDDPETFALIQSTRTLGCFQIESPGQRTLIGTFEPETFDDLIIDISLFRPGPVKSDMVTPFLQARQGWAEPQYLHPDLRPILAETYGVVVFHEQVLRILATMTGCSLAEADETRRAMGSSDGQDDVRTWFYPAALRRGYEVSTVDAVWDVLRAFASFGFCKAHAAAFALPTYQSAWFKAHHPAAFLAGVLTHDPGMYPKRLIVDDARNFGIAILGVDVNLSDGVFRVERIGPGDEPPPGILGAPPRAAPPADLPDGRCYGIRLSLAEIKGISEVEVDHIVTHRPYASLTDFWHRARVSQPIVERLIRAGGFDSLYGLGSTIGVRRRGRVTRRDLLLQAADLGRVTGRTRRRPTSAARSGAESGAGSGAESVAEQLTLDIIEEDPRPSGLPEMDSAERVRAEVEILGMDISQHVVDFYTPLLDDLGVTRSRDLLRCRSRSEILVAGVKVATQTPPVRSGRRVIFLTLDDGTGPVDAAAFDDAQGPYAATLFGSWLLLVRGVLRRTGPRGISVRITGCWDLGRVHHRWQSEGLAAVHELLAEAPTSVEPTRRRVLVHASGFRQSPYADIRPAGTLGPGDGPPASDAPSKLWHSSPGSSGW